MKHEIIDQRSLAMHRRMAEIIDADPERAGLQKARSNLARWLQNDPDCPALREWQEILNMPWEKVRQVILDLGTEGRRLRQSTPFAGILPEKERQIIFEKYAE